MNVRGRPGRLVASSPFRRAKHASTSGAHYDGLTRVGVDPIWWTVSLRCCSLHGMYQLELDGAGVVDRRVAALDVVEAVDVVADR